MSRALIAANFTLSEAKGQWRHCQNVVHGGCSIDASPSPGIH